MGRCLGAIIYDEWMNEGRLVCHRETGSDGLLLCGGCRIVANIEFKKRQKAAWAGLASVSAALASARPPKTRSEEKSDEQRGTDQEGDH